MKKLYIYIAILSLLVIFSSCEENFNPKGQFQEKYVLNCVLSGDTSYQVAILTKSYNVPGFDPYKNTVDPALDSADIRLWQGDSVYIFRDTLVDRIGTKRYDSPLKIFYLKNFTPEFRQSYEIEALLPNGRRLKSSSQSVPEVDFDLKNSTVVIPPSVGNYVNIYWNIPKENTLFVFTYTVNYYQKIDGVNVPKKVNIPIYYVLQNGQYVPNYSTPSNLPSANFSMDAITRTLENISKNDPNKQNFYVNITNSFKLFVLDDNLSKYYSSNTGGNDFTVRLDELDYTNIEGGYGVFGSFFKKTYKLKFTADYIRSFGYNPIFN